MMQIVLVAMGAGAAAALLFASIASGSPLRIAAVLSRTAADPDRRDGLEPPRRPARRAARGDRPRRSSLGFISLAFLFGVGLPAWWLGYLALLGRPVAANGSPARWSGIRSAASCCWAAIIGALVIVAAVLNFGTDKADASRPSCASAFERALQRPGPAIPSSRAAADTERVIDVLVIVAAAGRRGAADDPQRSISGSPRGSCRCPAGSRGRGPICRL